MIFAQSFNWKTWAPPTLHSPSLDTWQLNIPFTSAIYPALYPTPFPLVSLTCVAWVKCPTERHRFREFLGTTNPQKWQAIGLYGEKRNTVKLTGYPDSTLDCPSFPLSLCFSLSTAGQLNRQQFLQWQSQFDFFRPSPFCGHILVGISVVSGLSCL